ncbi:hypothetical protein CDL12_00214 [Handroanthus impetiginosus]|uniref:Disease resistance protein At4g27190-like leucine-rich repeats domain-containing protein n=1 Tax=Handroanthus impetiginosus TaxID=429701 RepID=A0A2G9IB93_9LAMI|nr:hypothetical protein CDL12_00214 [Handroanthus impetiginosus]
MFISGSYLNEIPNEGGWIKDLEKVSPMNNKTMEILDRMSLDCPKLITLILNVKSPLKCISDSFFSHLYNLSVLDLSSTLIKKSPHSLSNLENVKFLNPRNCWRLVRNPDLGKLWKLRDHHVASPLDMSRALIRKVPQGMEELVNLRFLSLHEITLFRLPDFIGLIQRFQNLEEIFIRYCREIEEIIEVRQGEGEGRVVSLPKLKKLSLWDLPRLKSICNTTMSCDSIGSIQLIGCQEIKKLPLYFDPISHSPPQTLEHILLRERE